MWSFYKAMGQMFRLEFAPGVLTSTSCAELSEWCPVWPCIVALQQ